MEASYSIHHQCCCGQNFTWVSHGCIYSKCLISESQRWKLSRKWCNSRQFCLYGSSSKHPLPMLLQFGVAVQVPLLFSKPQRFPRDLGILTSFSRPLMQIEGYPKYCSCLNKVLTVCIHHSFVCVLIPEFQNIYIVVVN